MRRPSKPFLFSACIVLAGLIAGLLCMPASGNETRLHRQDMAQVGCSGSSAEAGCSGYAQPYGCAGGFWDRGPVRRLWKAGVMRRWERRARFARWMAGC